MYYNTTNLGEATESQFALQANRQETAVLEFFRRNKSEQFSPEDIHVAVLSTAPLTSARRAITNLTKHGHLVRCDERVDGSFGRPVYLWRLNATNLRPALAETAE